MINVNAITSTLAKLPDPALQQYAQMHKNDPYVIALAVSESNRRKELRSAAQASAAPTGGAPVVDSAIQSMAAELPEEVGIGALPAPNMAFADGGVVGYAKGGRVSFEDMLELEGVTNPQARAFLKSIFEQESSSGKNTKTSAAGAEGAMQVLPGTFKSVADPGWSRANPEHNIRAGIRYGLEALQKASGDMALAATYYYGGPKGMAAAQRGEARFVPATYDPKGAAPSTLQYGQQVADRAKQSMGDEPPTASAADTTPTNSRLAEIDARIADLRAQMQREAKFGAGLGAGFAPTAGEIAQLTQERQRLTAGTERPAPPVQSRGDDEGELQRKLGMRPAPAAKPASQAAPTTDLPPVSSHDVLGRDLLNTLQGDYTKALGDMRGQQSGRHDALRTLYDLGVPKGQAYESTERRLNDADAGHAEQLKENKKLAFIRAGLGMLSSTSPHAGVGIGTGALQGLDSYTAGLSALRKSQADRDGQRATIDDARRREQWLDHTGRMRMETGFGTEASALDTAGLSGLARNQGLAITAAHGRSSPQIQAAERIQQDARARGENIPFEDAYRRVAQAGYDPRASLEAAKAEVAAATKELEAVRFLGPDRVASAQNKLAAAQERLRLAGGYSAEAGSQAIPESAPRAPGPKSIHVLGVRPE